MISELPGSNCTFTATSLDGLRKVVLKFGIATLSYLTQLLLRTAKATCKPLNTEGAIHMLRIRAELHSCDCFKRLFSFFDRWLLLRLQFPGRDRQGRGISDPSLVVPCPFSLKITSHKQFFTPVVVARGNMGNHAFKNVF